MIDYQGTNLLSVIKNPDIIYPDSNDFFSPDQYYPEYQFTKVSDKINFVYRSIRQCLFQLGLDKPHFGTPKWNPLGDYIKSGAKVFVLCNFVNHRNSFESFNDFISKCSHGSVLRAVIDFALIAVGKSGEVAFGNAPIQSADFNRVLRLTGADRVIDFYKSNAINVKCCDLRLYKIDKHLSGEIKQITLGNPDDSVEIDLGAESLLEELYEDATPYFRISDYDPDKTEKNHSKGVHRYSISKKILESDVIISLPKLKTHEKVGITVALKGCVGAVSYKDCLAHYRHGSINVGGDGYETDPFKVYQLISNLNELAYHSNPSSLKGKILRIIDINLQRISRRFSVKPLGSWQGNDTCWRMALDVARIVIHGSPTGMKLNQPRPHLVFVDGVIGGEGQGPLSPHAVNSGIVLFATNPVLSDLACAIMMGFDPCKLPIVYEALELSKYPLTLNFSNDLSDPIIYNGIDITIDELNKYFTYKFKPPKGWDELIE